MKSTNAICSILNAVLQRAHTHTKQKHKAVHICACCTSLCGTDCAFPVLTIVAAMTLSLLSSTIRESATLPADYNHFLKSRNIPQASTLGVGLHVFLLSSACVSMREQQRDKEHCVCIRVSECCVQGWGQFHFNSGSKQRRTNFPQCFPYKKQKIKMEFEYQFTS